MKRDVVPMELSCHIGSVIGLTALITNADPNVAVWTTAITVAGGLLLQFMRDRREERRWSRDKEELTAFRLAKRQAAELQRRQEGKRLNSNHDTSTSTTEDEEESGT